MRYLILILLLTVNLKVYGDQILPDGFKSLPILIEIPDKDNPNDFHCGTGIYLVESNKLFLVTAAHVLFNFNSTNRMELINSNATFTSFSPDPKEKQKFILSVDLKGLQSWQCLLRHPSHDVAVIFLGYAPLADPKHPDIGFVNQYNKFIRLKSDYRMQFGEYAADEACILSTNILDGADTYLFGYPVDFSSQPLAAEIDVYSPMLRRGIISQKNTITSKLIIDSGVYGGNSGGPVLIVSHEGFTTRIQDGGIITEFVPFATKLIPQIGVTNSDLVNSGYSVAEPIDYTIELMNKLNLTTQGSEYYINYTP